MSSSGVTKKGKRKRKRSGRKKKRRTLEGRARGGRRGGYRSSTAGLSEAGSEGERWACASGCGGQDVAEYDTAEPFTFHTHRNQSNRHAEVNRLMPRVLLTASSGPEFEHDTHYLCESVIFRNVFIQFNI